MYDEIRDLVLSGDDSPDLPSILNNRKDLIVPYLEALNDTKYGLNLTNGGDLLGITSITDRDTYYLTNEGDDSKYVRLKSDVELPYTYDGSGIPDMDYFDSLDYKTLLDKYDEFDLNSHMCRLPIKHGAGLMDFEITNGENVMWLLSDGSISYDTRPAVTLPAGTSYLYASNLWSNTVELRDQATDSNYLGDLSSVSNLTYYLSLYNCTNITGDLSSVSNLTYYLSLANCTNITGDLSSVSNLTYYLSLVNCTNITGDLSSVSNLTHYLSLTNCTNITGDLSIVSNLTYLLSLSNCTNITGDLSSVSNLTYYLDLTNCTNITGILNPTSTIKRIYLAGTGMSANDTDQTLINLRNNTTITSDGILQIKANRTSASDDAYNYLTTNGWTITEI